MNFLTAVNFSFSYDIDDKNDVLFVLDSNYLIYAFQSYNNGKNYLNAIENKKNSIYIPYITYIELVSNISNKVATTIDDIITIKEYFKSARSSKEFINSEYIKVKLTSASFEDDRSRINNLKNVLLKNDITEVIKDYAKNTNEKVKEKINEINVILNEELSTLKELEKELPCVEKYTENTLLLSEKIENLILDNKLLGKKYSQSDIEEYLNDMEERYKNEIPPGFDDKPNKGESERKFGNLKYPTKAGDLILWKDIINMITNNKDSYEKYTKVILVTDDGLAQNKNAFRVFPSSNKESLQDKITNPDLKIEFFEKTGKFFDLMKVEDFIKYYSSDNKETKDTISNEIRVINQSENIDYVFLNESFSERHQYGMFYHIFETVLHLYNLSYVDIEKLPCISLIDVPKNSIFDSNRVVVLSDDSKIVLGSRLSMSDKIRYLKSLFLIAGISKNNLKFLDSNYNDLWLND